METANSDGLKGQYPSTLIEAFALHLLFEKLGYSVQDDVRLILGAEVSVELRQPGMVERFRIGEAELPKEDLRQLWEELLAQWNSMSKEEQETFWETSTPAQNELDISGNLIRQGFLPHLSSQKPQMLH